MKLASQIHLPEAAAVRTIVEAAGRQIPPLWPLASHVAVNPYLGQTGERLANAGARLRRVGGARELYQMMHAEIDDAEDRPVDLTLFLRFFAGSDAAAMGLGQQLSETAAASIERPLVPLKTAFSAWQQLEHAAEGATVPALRPAPCQRPRAR